MPQPALSRESLRIKSSFLEGLTPAELNHVLASGRERRFPAGKVICNQGEPANHVFLVLHGRARYFILTPQGEKILLLWLPEGELIGSAALQRPHIDYIVSTETVKDSTILVWDKPIMRRLAMRYPRLLDNALLIATRYLAFYVATHIGLTCHSASQRLAAVLLHLSHGIGQIGPRGIELDVSNEELAQASNISPFTVSRLIGEWHRQGVLVKQRGKILLLSPGKLPLRKI